VRAAGVLPNWTSYVTVEDGRSTSSAARPGEPLELDHGSIAMARDPQGALSTLFAGETHP
jgi:hypothetical protein